MTEVPEVTAETGPTKPYITPSAYLVSLLPEGHDDRYLFTCTVDYRGNGQWSVKNRSRILGADGSWTTGFDWSGGPDEPATEEDMAVFDREQTGWLAAHRFDEATALRLAEEACRALSYRGWSAEDALAGRGGPSYPMSGATR